MSSEPPLEFFFDRSLGKETARRLRSQRGQIRLLSEVYPDDAQETADETWLAEGSERGWILLSKDQRIRYRGAQLAALHQGRLFCLANGNLTIDEMTSRLIAARARIEREVRTGGPGFWKVYDRGRLVRTWP